jgi:hypothetical protein
MRLTKTAQFIEEVDTGQTTPYGEPIVEKTLGESFEMEIEPFSAELAKNSYGVIADVTYRMFTYPNEKIFLGNDFVYNGWKFKIEAVKDFDKHYEVLVDRVGVYVE